MTVVISAAPDLLTRRQAAVYLSLKEQTLACWASAGRNDLPFFKVGRSVRYKRADLDRWLESRTRTATA